MKRKLVCLLSLLSCWAASAASPSQLLSAAAPFQALSDRDLNVVNAYQLSQLSVSGGGGTNVLYDLSNCSNYPASKLVGGMALVATNGIIITTAGTNNFVGMNMQTIVATNAPTVPYTNVLIFGGLGTYSKPSGIVVADGGAYANSLYWWNYTTKSYTNKHGYGLAFDSDGTLTLGGGWYLTNAQYNPTASPDNPYIAVSTLSTTTYFYPYNQKFADQDNIARCWAKSPTNYTIMRVIDGDVPVLLPQ